MVRRRHAGALRGLWLAGDPGREWPRCGRDGSAFAEALDALRQADADLLQDHHRLGLAEQGRHPRCAWRRPWAKEAENTRAALAGPAARSRFRSRCGTPGIRGPAVPQCKRRGTSGSPPTSAEYPAEAAEFLRRTAGTLPADFAARADAWIASAEKSDAVIATRKSSQQAIAALAPMLPEFFRRLGRPDRIQLHRLERLRRSYGAPAPAIIFITACANSAWRRS
jgi:hypothetical protein